MSYDYNKQVLPFEGSLTISVKVIEDGGFRAKTSIQTGYAYSKNVERGLQGMVTKAIQNALFKHQYEQYPDAPEEVSYEGIRGLIYRVISYSFNYSKYAKVKRIKVRGRYVVQSRDKKGRIISGKKWSNKKTSSEELTSGVRV